MATFVGRQSEHHEVAALLDEHRVVTLVGPGGIGKTRLATELSGSVAAGYAGGIYFSELAGTSDRDDIASVVAGQHGFGSLESLRVAASGQPTLIVLDNCESALRQASDVAAALVADGDAITVLATSRAPLQIYGERIYVVTPLELPRDEEPGTVREAAAARLFLERAEAVGAVWPVDDENLLAVGRIVRSLDGLPLAIELAAARSRMLTPPELLRHLDRQLDLLAAPGDGATARHSSLRGAIQTSYEPLPDDQKEFFRALSVFSAPFELSLAHGVAGGLSATEFDTLDRLTRLVEYSLVDARHVDDGRTLYRLLDSIRAFGLEQLLEAGEGEAVGDRYVDAVLDFADRITEEGLKSFSASVLGRIRDQFVHLVHCIDRCIITDDDPGRAYRMFIPMYGPTGARTEVAALGQRMRERWDVSAPFEAEAWAVLATATFLRGDSERAGPIAQEAIDHPEGTAMAKFIGHRVLGFIAGGDGDTDAAMAHLEAAIELAAPFSGSFTRELQASWGAVCRDPSRSDEALEVLAELSRVARQKEEMVTVVWSCLATAHHHVLLGDLAAAHRAADDALAVAHQTGFPWSVGSSHRMVGAVLVREGRWDAAAPHFRTAADETLSMGDIEGVVVTLRAAASGAAWLGDQELADELWATVPAGRGRPIIGSFFEAEEDELEERLGGPTRDIEVALVARMRELLGPAHDDTIDHGAAPPAPAIAGAAPTGAVLRFGDCELDLAMRELRRDGERVHVEPQVFDLLVLLVERRGTVATKADILDEVWGDRFVSESALTSRIKSARRAVGDDGRTQAVIRTVHGHGYSFVAEVENG